MMDSRLNLLEDDAMERGDNDELFDQLNENVYMDFHDAVQKYKEDQTLNIWDHFNECSTDMVKSLTHMMESDSSKPFIRATLRAVSHENRAYQLILRERQLKEDFDHLKDVSALANLVCTDKDFRLIYCVWQWSQLGALEDPKGFSELIHEYNSLGNVRVLRRGSRDIFVNSSSGVDIDSPCSTEEAELQEKLIRIIFSLIRCGNVDDAISLVKSVGLASLATPLRMYGFLTNPEESPLNPLDENASIATQRLVFLKVLRKLIDCSNVSTFTKMVWCSLAGCLEPLLSMAIKTEDRLWCYANAAVQNRLQEMCSGTTTDDVPLSVSAIFGEILAAEKSPYYALYSYLLQEDWSELCHWMENYLNTTNKLDDQLLRFMANVLSIIKVKGFDEDDSCAMVIYDKFIQLLADKKLFSMIPLYASFLPRETSDNVLLQLMKQIEGDEVRQDYLIAVENAGFSRDTLAILASTFSREQISHEERLNRIRWLLINGESTMSELVEQVNILLRYFMLNHLESAYILIKECALFSVPEMISKVTKENGSDKFLANIEEFICHQHFLETYTTNNKLAEVAFQCSATELEKEEETPHRQADLWQGLDLVSATEKDLEKKMKQSEHRRQMAYVEIYYQKSIEMIEKLLKHAGWRDLGESARSSELSQIRDKYFTDLLDVFLTTCHMVRLQKPIVDVTVLLAEEDVQIGTYFSKEQLRRVVQKIHDLAGSCF